MFVFPTPVIGRTGGARTYAEFLAHITSRESFSQSGEGDIGYATAYSYRVTSLAASHSMRGSPWNGRRVSFSSKAQTVVLHGLPSEAVFAALISAGTQVFFRTEAPATAFAEGLDRNGFASSSVGGESSITVPELLYWDPATSQAIAMNPYAGTGPVPYSF